MRWSSFQQRLRALFFRQKTESELDEELTAHLEFQIKKHLAAGIPEAEARRRARIQFGAVEAAREDCREIDRWRWIDVSIRNTRYCFRLISKSPLMAIIFILVLTVSIGSVLAAFSILDALLLRPLDVEHPEELIKISMVFRNGHLLELPSSSLDILQKSLSIQGVCGFDESLSGVQTGDTTLAFVTASTLLAASLKNMYNIDFGIDARNLWEVELSGRQKNFDAAANYRVLLEDIESLPQVQSAALSGSIPFYSYDYREPVAIMGDARFAGDVQARQIDIGDHFFSTVGAKIVAGDDFRRDDANARNPAVILSESLARHFGHPSDLIGRRLKMGDLAGDKFFRIIGVVSDTDLNLANLDDTKPYTVYFNLLQGHHPLSSPILLIRTRGGVLPITLLRRTAKQNGYDYIDRATTISAEIDNALVENRLLAYLSEAFSALALIMAAVGLFGLLSYQVSNRTAEIGIRMALGAQRRQIRWLVLGQVARIVVVGSVGGLALLFAIGRLIAGLLYGVGAYDVAPLLISAAALTATAIAAAWIPVRRASSIDPVMALRHE